MITSRYTTFIQVLKYALILLCFIPMNVSGQCTENGNYWNKSWQSCRTSPNPNPNRGDSHWILYEFEESQNISESHFWNANRSNESEMGIKVAEIDYSTDGTTWTNLGTFNFDKANEQDGYQGVEGPDFGGIFIKKVLFTVTETYGDGQCASIAEVQFKINPDACYGTIDACGECDGPGELTWYIDEDNDGLGHIETALQSCNQPAGYVANADDYCDNGLLGWNKVGAIFRDNGCTGCHGNNAIGGLNLTSYETARSGGNKCGTNILSGTTLTDIITTTAYAGCGTPIGIPSMNDRVGGQIDAAELSLLQTWIDAGAPNDCNCLAGAPDADNDETCDAIDDCPNFDNRWIGTACDDGLVCTENDVWTSACNCAGQAALDSDNDGVCDVEDAAPNDACTADGTIDGIEPARWIALPTNDCDTDGVNNVNRDLNDFDACIDHTGKIRTVACNCINEAAIAGGNLVNHIGIGGVQAYAHGLPDGTVTNYIGGADSLILGFPYLALGEEICITVGFSSADGKVNFSVNNNSFTYLNTSGLIDYQLQEYCFKTLNAGTQTVVITEVGSGGIRVDGSMYSYCPCSESDPKFETPDCNCMYDTVEENGTYLNSVGIGNAANADGAPDGIFTNNISYLPDTLNLYFSTITTQSEICITIGFSDEDGLGVFDLNGELFYAPNILKDSLYTPQEFCIVTNTIGAQTVEITERGSGVIRVDGSTQNYCDACLPDANNNNKIQAQIHAYLEGAYDPTDNEMATALNLRGLLPGQNPISPLATPTPVGQPYHTAPWSYAGAEGATWTDINYTNNEVDWVLVSFRTGIAKSTEVAMTSALLNKDGRVNFIDRCALPYATDSLYVVIEHRNHMGVMSAQPVPIINNTLTYDFRAADSYKNSTSFGQKKLSTGEWVMYAGDSDQVADVASYDINGSDKTLWFINNGVFDYYLSPDFNLDGDINGQDKVLWYDNNGFSSRVPK